MLLTATYSADKQGYDELIIALQNAGNVKLVGVEGTNSYGAGLTRALIAAGYTVKEVLRPSRQVRRMRGKSDSIDAIEAARSLLAGKGVSDAKDSDTPAESLRFLLAARAKLINTATALGNCVTSLLTTAPETVRGKYRGLTIRELSKRIHASRPSELIDDPHTAAMHAIQQLARTREDIIHRADELERKMHRILIEHFPQVLAIYGAGAIIAAQLVVTAGGNPHRIRDEAAFASLCGVAPIPASSGRTNRHRLNRGGDRRGNSALHRIALIRMRRDERTRAYVERRIGEGKSKREILRCLKRAIAREVYRALTIQHTETNQHQDLRHLRDSKRLTQAQAARALNTYPARISDIERQRRPLPELTARYEQWLQTA